MRAWGRRTKRGDNAVSGGGEVVPGEVAAALAGAAFAEGKQAGQACVGGLGGGVDQDGRAVGQVEAAADDRADIRFFSALMGADDAGRCPAVGNAQRGQAEHGGAGEQLLDVGGAAEEGEVRGGL